MYKGETFYYVLLFKFKSNTLYLLWLLCGNFINCKNAAYHELIIQFAHEY